VSFDTDTGINAFYSLCSHVWHSLCIYTHPIYMEGDMSNGGDNDSSFQLWVILRQFRLGLIFHLVSYFCFMHQISLSAINTPFLLLFL
jgi:hypothetical protein